MSDCNHDCSNCASKCDSAAPMKEATHEGSRVKKVIAVMSGKGGVGKSLITGLLASAMNKKGFSTAVLDADITGPSVPQMFGIHGNVEGDGTGIYPISSEKGVKVISSNLLLANERDPIVWRGALISGMVKQFWTDVIWGDVDYMFVDCPPGTGDVPLTVFQSVKVDGIIVVTSPQELVSMIVAKAVRMAEMMKVPILGVVENMSYVVCPCCGKEIDVFGNAKVDEVATDYHLKVLGRMPIDPSFAAACDAGKIEDLTVPFLEPAVSEISRL